MAQDPMRGFDLTPIIVAWKNLHVQTVSIDRTHPGPLNMRNTAQPLW
jgi:hypothetical protein